jgi:hypothetical protein
MEMTNAETLQKYLPCHTTYGDFDLCVECPYNPKPGKIWKYGCAHGQDKMIEDAIALLKEQPEIVRCKDCEYYKDGFCYNPNTFDDEKTRGNTVPDWYCADGKRRTDDV